MLSKLDTSDWKHAFEYASPPYIEPVPPTSDVSLTGFDRADVTGIAHIEEGEYDEDHWMCIGQLRDGRWFCLEAGCDRTGWDCRAGGWTTVSRTYAHLIRLGCSEDIRRRFRLTWPVSVPQLIT